MVLQQPLQTVTRSYVEIYNDQIVYIEKALKIDVTLNNYTVGKLEILVIFYGVKYRHFLCVTIWNRTRKFWPLIGIILNVIKKVLNLRVILLIWQSWLSLVLYFLWNFKLALLKFVLFDHIWRNGHILQQPLTQIRICSSAIHLNF